MVDTFFYFLNKMSKSTGLFASDNLNIVDRTSIILQNTYHTVYPLMRRLEGSARWRRETGASTKECLVAIWSGFSPRSYAFLGLDSRDSAKYVSHEDIMKLNGDARRVLHDKLATHSIFSEFSEYFPTLYGTIHNGRYYSRDGITSSLSDTVKKHGTVVAKPVAGSEGDGFHLIRYDGEYSINNNGVGDIELIKMEKEFDDYIITEYIRQHSYSDDIFSKTVNTIRLLTVIDPETGQPEVVRASHRFGTEESAPTDNWAKGGVAAPINLDTASLEPLVVLDEFGERSRMNVHPETGNRISGVQIPMLDDMVEIAERASKQYPRAQFIAWDIVLTEDGPVILEASGMPGIHVLQLDEGLLENPVVKRAFETSKFEGNQ